MGNHPSAHQPLERTAVNSNPLRLSKRDKSPVKRMDRLRRSFRDSFRRRKESHIPESSKPHQWQADESAVRSATCAFHVKYLGCVEVFESRGMQVCEEAIKVLRNSRRRPVRAILHVSGDGLRVVEDETKGLIVDQTIEKVSFCAPDRNHEKGFSYICRDGTTRRWMCHGFLALKESGERLSHAVGCAFAACLERKQRRDKECAVTMTFDSKTSTFTRSGSFRQPSLTEKLQESQERAVDVPPVKQVYNPFAIERPHATPSMLERQGSFRGFNQLNQASPFKRQLSLRINDLPSNLERTRSHSLEPTDLTRLPNVLPPIIPPKPSVSPIPEISPSAQDSVSAMCQQLSRGLTLLSNNDDFTSSNQSTIHLSKQLFTPKSPMFTSSNSLDDMKLENGSSINNNLLLNGVSNINKINNNKSNNVTSSNNNNNNELDKSGEIEISWQETQSINHRLTPILNTSLSPVVGKSNQTIIVTTSTTSTTTSIQIGDNTQIGNSPNQVFNVSVPTSSSSLTNHSPNKLTDNVTSNLPSVSGFSSSSNISNTSNDSKVVDDLDQTKTMDSTLPKPEQWLGSVTGSVQTPKRVPPPPLHTRALSLGSSAMSAAIRNSSDPFDAEWAEIAARNFRQSNNTTNPFIVPNTTQAFQVQL